jgi:hypothetical protein
MTTLGWIVLGLVGWALGLIIVLTLSGWPAIRIGRRGTSRSGSIRIRT